MRKPFIAIAAAALLLLAGCKPAPPDPLPEPIVPVHTPAGAAPAAEPDTSVPSATSVFAPVADAAPADAAAGRSNKAMSLAQESGAMPVPGQNNDHSAALAPARRASGP
jgi:hypothetical protein